MGLKPLFPLGRVVMTPGAIAALAQSKQKPSEFLIRHLTGDWGILDASDKRANDTALKRGDRILSHYKTAKDDRIYIITEHDRSLTTLLTPDDY